MGRYVPPDQEGVTSSNKVVGKHPLGSRARNVNSTGELTVRFEMPFAVWCSTCKPPQTSSNNTGTASTAEGSSEPEHILIGQGVRFNAQKKRVGNYYSTPIWSFRMKHTACGGWIEIHTNPKNTEYVVVEGARRKVTSQEEDAGPLGLWVEESGGEKSAEIQMRNKGSGGADAEGGESDPFARFESKVSDEREFKTARNRMEELRKRQERDWEDPYEMSRKLRKTFRTERKGREAAQSKADALTDKMSLGIELVEEQEVDRMRAGLVDFRSSEDRDSGEVRTRGLFEPSANKTRSETGGNGKVAGKKSRYKKNKAAADFALERKNKLRQELSGNTRAAIDPFLSDEKVWQPGFNVRRKVEAGNGDFELSRPRNSDGRLHGGNTSPDPGRGGIEDESTSGDLGSQQHHTALVHYGSDTD